MKSLIDYDMSSEVDIEETNISWAHKSLKCSAQIKCIFKVVFKYSHG